MCRCSGGERNASGTGDVLPRAGASAKGPITRRSCRTPYLRSLGGHSNAHASTHRYFVCPGVLSCSLLDGCSFTNTWVRANHRSCSECHLSPLQHMYGMDSYVCYPRRSAFRRRQLDHCGADTEQRSAVCVGSSASPRRLRSTDIAPLRLLSGGLGSFAQHET